MQSHSEREREGESRETQRGQRGAGRGSLVAGGQHGTGQGCGARGGLLEGRGGHGATGTLVGMVVAASVADSKGAGWSVGWPYPCTPPAMWSQ